MKLQFKKIFLFLCAQIYWMFDFIKEAVENGFEKLPVELCASMLLSAVILIFVKDAVIGWSLSTALVVFMNFQNIDYLLLMIPALLLVAANKEASKRVEPVKKSKKNQKNEKKELNIFALLSICFGVFVLIYSTIEFFAPNQESFYTDFFKMEYVLILVALIFIAVVNFSELKKSQDDFEAKNLKKNCTVSVISIVLYIEMIGYCAVHLNGDYHYARVILLPWFEYLCILALTEDMSVINLGKAVFGIVTKLAEKKQVEK